MTARIVPRATLPEVLAFLKGLGIALDDDGRRALKKKLEEDPVSKPTLERSKALKSNALFKQILDLTFVERSKQIQRFADNNPLLKLIGEKRKSFHKDGAGQDKPMPEHLRQVFYDEYRWQPFFPFLGVPQAGQIIKIVEVSQPDRQYISFLRTEGGINMLYTTRRKVDIDHASKAKYHRLKEGVFQYEIDEIQSLENGFLEYILSFHP